VLSQHYAWYLQYSKYVDMTTFLIISFSHVLNFLNRGCLIMEDEVFLYSK